MKKINIKPGMSKYQIQRQLENAFSDALNNQHFYWTCGHGYKHKIRVGSLRKGVEQTLHCGCTVVGQ